MNKKLNTALFLIGATIANLLMIAIMWLVPTFLYMKFLAPFVSNNLTGLIEVVFFIAAILGTYWLYNAILGKIIAKIDMDKYFDPIFRKKKH